jgi:hypothetical protein
MRCTPLLPMGEVDRGAVRDACTARHKIGTSMTSGWGATGGWLQRGEVEWGEQRRVADAASRWHVEAAATGRGRGGRSHCGRRAR